MEFSWLIYHPKRIESKIYGIHIFHDQFGGNEDPYLWNNKFLHTYCHITQMTNIEGQINFWISGDTYPNFNKLYCDCVFVIKEKHFWKEKNNISIDDKIIDSRQAFEHHYKWANLGQHKFEKRRRYTLKADEIKSFQPQTKDRKLIDILPFLNDNGISTVELINSMTTKKGSRPFKFSKEIGERLYDYLLIKSENKVFGKDIMNMHPNIDNKINGCC